MKERLKLPKLCHIGVVVKDIEKVVEYYASTFDLRPFRTTIIDRQGAIVRGKLTDYKVKLAFFQLGDIQFELIQMFEGKTIQNEFLRTKSEGLHHIAFIVDDLEAEIVKWKKNGIKVLQRSKKHTPTEEDSYAYMDTDMVGGVIFELVQQRKGQ